MQYRECPSCGAHLDYGERCDCKKREDAPGATGTPSKGNAARISDIVSGISGNVNPSLRLREIRQKMGVMAKDAALVVREIFPKFNRQLLAQCEAWDKYGVVIHPDGLKAISEAYGASVPKQPTTDQAAQMPQTAGLNQCERILRHLKDYGSITSLEAMQEYGIMRLASRISDLKALGYSFTVVTERGKNRYGEKTSYARYSLKEGQDANRS